MSSTSKRPGLSADRPFPGLRPYLFDDHEFFFGREDQVFSLFSLFDHSRFIAVVGSSGSGKSSLVRAGLLPLLDEESRDATGRTWERIEFHPGDTPIGNLATAMASRLSASGDASVAAAQRERIRFALRQSSFGIADALRDIEGLGEKSIILVVDQFEELFRYAARQQGLAAAEEAQRHEEATQFVQLLLGASRDRARNIYVLLTMRSDFIGDCANFRGLPEAVSASQFLVPSLTRDQREQAIREPVEKAGATIEPALVERLLNDSGDDIDLLPVLQHCLLRLWEQAGRSGAGKRHLTTEHYLAIGGMSGALSKHADEIRRDLTGTGLAVEQLFRTIAEIDAEGRIIRRARLFKQLRAETGVPENDLRQAVDRFRDDDCSFLTPPKSEVPELADETRIDVGHEALLRRWERVSGDPRTGNSPYVGWLRAEELDGRIYRGLLSMAESKAGRIAADSVEPRWNWWTERPRTADWARRYGGGIEDVEHLFKESLAWLETEREQERRRAEEAADRQRIALEAVAAHDREAAALRFARLARTAAIIVSLLLVIAIGLSALSYRARGVAIEQQRIANEEKTKALQQQEIAISNLNKSIALATAFQSQVQELLDRGAISVSAAKQILTSANATFEQFKVAEQTPTIMASWATLLVAFADTYSAAQDYKTSLQLSRQARTIAAQLVAAAPGNAEYQRLLYSADFSCGDAEANTDDSMRDYDAALSIARTWAKSDPAHYVWMQRAAFITNKIGDTYELQGHADQALKTYLAALAIDQGLADAHPENDDVQRDLATSLTRVGDAEARGENPTDALAKFRQAMTIRKTLGDKDPGDSSKQSNLAVAYNRIAGILMKQDHVADAATLYATALAIRQNLAKGDPSNATWQSGLAFEHVMIGDLLTAKSDYTGATENYRASLSIRDNLSALDPDNFTSLRNLAESHTKLASALFNQGNLPDALAEYDAALALRLKISSQFPDSVARQRELIDAYLAIGDLALKQNDGKEAAARYQKALDVVRAYQSSHPARTGLDEKGGEITQKVQSLAQ